MICDHWNYDYYCYIIDTILLRLLNSFQKRIISTIFICINEYSERHEIEESLNLCVSIRIIIIMIFMDVAAVSDPWLSDLYERFHIGVTLSWGRTVLQRWEALLWILQLRFQCGLRVGHLPSVCRNAIQRISPLSVRACDHRLLWAKNLSKISWKKLLLRYEIHIL